MINIAHRSTQNVIKNTSKLIVSNELELVYTEQCALGDVLMCRCNMLG